MIGPLNTGKYIGLPSIVGRSKKVIFAHIRDRFWNRIQAWRAKPHSKAEREILIKAVAQAIPTYFMSVFLILSLLLMSCKKCLILFGVVKKRMEVAGSIGFHGKKIVFEKNMVVWVFVILKNSI